MDSIIRARDLDKKQATYVVYAPNEPDSHGTWATEEVIRDACHSFNIFNRKANLFHSVDTDLIEIVESYILPVDATIGDREIKRGTWLAVVQYKDDNLWEMELNGEIQGLSIGAKGVIGGA